MASWRARRAAAGARRAVDDALAAWRVARQTLHEETLAEARAAQRKASAMRRAAFAETSAFVQRQWRVRAAPRSVPFFAQPRPAQIRCLVGRCRRCGIQLWGYPTDVRPFRSLLATHEGCCPGGHRAAQKWIPSSPGEQPAPSARPSPPMMPGPATVAGSPLRPTISAGAKPRERTGITPRFPRHCRHCRVKVVGEARNVRHLLAMLTAHEQYCPGGDRVGHRWSPFGGKPPRPRLRRDLRSVPLPTGPE
jgi:hypothetical protein